MLTQPHPLPQLVHQQWDCKTENQTSADTNICRNEQPQRVYCFICSPLILLNQSKL